MDTVADGLFVMFGVVTLMLGAIRAYLWWPELREARRAGPPAHEPAPLTLHEVAFLQGRHTRVAETGMAALWLSGRLTVTGRHGVLIGPGPRPRDPAQAAVVAARGGPRGRDARQVRDAAAAAEGLRWVGSRLYADGLLRTTGLAQEPFRKLVRVHLVCQVLAGLAGAAWIAEAVAVRTVPLVAALVVAAVLAFGVVVARLTPLPQAASLLTPRARQLLAGLDPDGAWVRRAPGGRTLSAEEARTLAAVARQGLGALPHSSGLAHAVHGTRGRTP
ncbi:TIGR04222 domain-containing membrane protein [Streptomyces bambusae]|uniref:TIGR04222 domain-containing membrane protein n=1 Tax=Streptomyces bambusae TaxID=1550616 RepID=UPI001CFF0262|nr:TIGR04222 domain-containing membrane protein [Streptomyces bambusae]MCB5167638.1 TIGR04222 domain-containing membrane protein [Streptomyces bambusae]